MRTDPLVPENTKPVEHNTDNKATPTNIEAAKDVKPWSGMNLLLLLSLIKWFFKLKNEAKRANPNTRPKIINWRLNREGSLFLGFLTGLLGCLLLTRLLALSLNLPVLLLVLMSFFISFLLVGLVQRLIFVLFLSVDALPAVPELLNDLRYDASELSHLHLRVLILEVFEYVLSVEEKGRHGLLWRNWLTLSINILCRSQPSYPLSMI